jgi:hypothetical protein
MVRILPLRGSFIQQPAMTQKRPLMRFPSWVGVFSASAANQSSDCPESANGIGDRMTRQGDLSGCLSRAENGGFDWVPFGPFFRFGI